MILLCCFFVDSFKSGLIEFALKSKMKVPEFHSRSEGQSHAPKFRSSVMVDGLVFTTGQTFSHRKVADEEVSKSALEWLINKIIPEGYSLISKVCYNNIVVITNFSSLGEYSIDIESMYVDNVMIVIC
jgi:hypothetical protein